ncbi:MAG: nucleoside triphosphate pyrophosphohydrolase [Bacteroidota bacterium]|nr:nucleoside triphosphate pyrophosphohydrolase [Bacteroidota bacterium]
MEKTLESFANLLAIMDELREKCPWDSVQTFDSLRNLTTEEVYELTDAIFEKDMQNIKKELGDLLLHIVFYSKLGSEQNEFNIKNVIDSINEKLIFRHPHIFGDTKVSTPEEVEENWEKLKLKEKGGNKTVLSGIPKTLPACIKAFRIQDKARGVGFDWDKKEQVWDKVKEEINEFSTEMENQNSDKMEDEFGDILFALINAGRLYGINPENALEKTNRKFIKRFSFLEEKTIKKGLDLKKMSLDEMEKIWQESKKFD